ncbi:MAG: hypothetical protein WBX15_18170 [Thermoanaerobaculia bacterium]
MYRTIALSLSILLALPAIAATPVPTDQVEITSQSSRGVATSYLGSITVAGKTLQLFRGVGRSITFVREDGESFELNLRGETSDRIWLEGRYRNEHIAAEHELRATTPDPSLVALARSFREFVDGNTLITSADTVNAESWGCALAVTGWGLSFAGLVMLTPATGGASIFVAVASFEVASASLYACA